MVVKKAIRSKKSGGGGGVTNITYNGVDTYSREQVDAMMKDLSGDEVKSLVPFGTRTNEIILRNATNGYAKYDVVATNNYNTYFYEVEPDQLIEITQTGTGYGSSTLLAGAFYNSDTTLDHTTAVSSAYNNADSRKVIGTAREVVPSGAVTLAITTHKNNTVTVKTLKFSRVGEVEDKLKNAVIPHNEWFSPFFNGQLAYDATNSNTYIAFNKQWKLITTT